MTDEELIQMKHAIETRCICFSKATGNLINLITAEQQRRSVRTEDVQRAIERFERLREESLSHLSIARPKLNKSSMLCKTIEETERIYALAITALEAYQKPNPIEHNCGNCFYLRGSAYDEPCKNCSVNKGSNWKGENNG